MQCTWREWFMLALVPLACTCRPLVVEVKKIMTDAARQHVLDQLK